MCKKNEYNRSRLNLKGVYMTFGKLYCACCNQVCRMEVDFNPNTLLWRPMINGHVVQFYTRANGRRCVPVFADRQLAYFAVRDILDACKYNRVCKSCER